MQQQNLVLNPTGLADTRPKLSFSMREFVRQNQWELFRTLRTAFGKFHERGGKFYSFVDITLSIQDQDGIYETVHVCSLRLQRYRLGNRSVTSMPSFLRDNLARFIDAGERLALAYFAEGGMYRDAVRIIVQISDTEKIVGSCITRDNKIYLEVHD
jgi:hypothetical protein